MNELEEMVHRLENTPAARAAREQAEQERRRREAAERQAALATPATLATYLDPTYQVRDYLTLIGDELARLTPDGDDRLIISTPPQVGKSTTAAVWGTFWWHARHPTDNVAITCYGDGLAHTHSTAIQNRIVEHGAAYDLALARPNAAAHHWFNNHGGSVHAGGVGSGLTGYGFQLMFVDDPHKDRVEADSEAHRERVIGWWSSTALSRMAPGAPVVVIGTRWHPDDLIGWLLKNEGRDTDGGTWRMVQLPALADSPTDPLGRTIGAPLAHPRIADGDTERLNRHWHGRRKSSTPRDWSALYQGNPKYGGGTLVEAQTLIERRCYEGECTPAPARKVAVAVDPSGGGRDLAGIIGGYLGDDKRLYLTHDRSVYGPTREWSRAAVLLAHEIEADIIIVETNFGGDMATSAVRTAWDALQREGVITGGICPRVESVRARRGKLLRAEPVAQKWAEDWIRTAAYLPDLESEWCTWRMGADSPGRIDASVYLAFRLLTVPGAKTLISTPPAAAAIGRAQPGTFGRR